MLLGFEKLCLLEIDPFSRSTYILFRGKHFPSQRCRKDKPWNSLEPGFVNPRMFLSIPLEHNPNPKNQHFMKEFLEILEVWGICFCMQKRGLLGKSWKEPSNWALFRKLLLFVSEKFHVDFIRGSTPPKKRTNFPLKRVCTSSTKFPGTC